METRDPLQGLARPVRPPRRERGFSILEGLIAAAILLIVVVGVLPLLDRARRNNQYGSTATRLTSAATETFETRLALPFNALPLTVEGGNTVRETVDFYLFKGNRWSATLPAGDLPELRRETRVRQYSLSDLLEDGRLDNPLPGNATPSFVHLKVIEVSLWEAGRLRSDGNPMPIGGQPMQPRWRPVAVQVY